MSQNQCFYNMFLTVSGFELVSELAQKLAQTSLSWLKIFVYDMSLRVSGVELASELAQNLAQTYSSWPRICAFIICF